MTAYFLITHGSRSPRSVLARQKIETALKERCPQITIGGGCLEGQQQTLKEQMKNFARLTNAQRIIAIPLFLLKGVHTQVDVPEQIPDDRWQLTSILGDHPCMAKLLDQHFPKGGARAVICHGSNYPQATVEFERLVKSIGAKPLYWQQEWQHELEKSTWVLPYFLTESYTLTKIQAQSQAVNLLPSPLTPEVVAQMAQELASWLK